MTTKAVPLHDELIGLIGTAGFSNEAAQIRAKALLREVAQTQPFVSWTYIPSRVARNMTGAMLALEHIASSSPGGIDAHSGASRTLALLWEAFARLREGADQRTALLNAAVSYELAGYQANAACIAKRLSQPVIEGEPSLIDLSSMFFQRAFLRLRQVSAPLLREPALPIVQSHLEDMALAVAARALREAARFFLQGDERALGEADSALRMAEQLYVSLHLVEESNAIRGLRNLLPIMHRRATWTVLRHQVASDPRWDRYLKLLARGIGPDLLRGRSVSELWPSQLSALEHGLLNSDAHKIARMPTSSGKTRIAEMAIVQTLLSNQDARCVFVAPFRALATELEQSLFHVLADLGYRVATVTGSFESDEFEQRIVKETDVLVVTPEKLDLLLRLQREFVDRVRLFVLDEVQLINDERRGVKYELLLSRLRKRVPKARFLTLSAVVPDETLTDFAAWFNALPDRDVLRSSWRPSILRYAKFEWQKQTGVLRYAAESGEDGWLAAFVPGVIRQRTFEYTNPQTGKINRAKFPETTNRSQIAAELALRFASLGPVLVFCAQRSYVDSVAKSIIERLRLAQASGEEVPPSLALADLTRRSVSLAEEWLGERPALSWLRAGIGVHHGQLPDAVRKAVETDFRQRKLPILVATSTLAQGVNLPVRTIIMHSSSRYGPEGRTPLSAREYWNIAGRAGRAGEETEALVIHIKTRDEDEADFRYYAERRHSVEAVKSGLYQRLLAVLEERISEEGLKADLNPELLALLVEEAPEEPAIIANEILQNSLVRVQARTNEAVMDKFAELFVDVAQKIDEDITDRSYLAHFSSTGLSSGSCGAIAAHVREIEPVIANLLRNAQIEDLDRLIDTIVPQCLRLTETAPRREVSGNQTEMLKRWVHGATATQVLAFEEAGEADENIGRFVDETFGYLLPWGVAAYIRIAAFLVGCPQAELSEVTKFLPAMIKYGVSDPVACWVMSIGVPFRRVAVEMAQRYREEAERAGYEDFRLWLGTVSAERLRHEFRLVSPFLEDVARAVFNAAVNPTLRAMRSLEDILPCETEVRGVAYENRRVAALKARPGSTVDLVRDYDNPVDRNAIAVYLQGEQLGYVPRPVAQILAPEMDTGTPLSATIRFQRGGEVPSIGLRIVRSGR